MCSFLFFCILAANQTQQSRPCLAREISYLRKVATLNLSYNFAGPDKSGSIIILIYQGQQEFRISDNLITTKQCERILEYFKCVSRSPLRHENGCLRNEVLEQLLTALGRSASEPHQELAEAGRPHNKKQFRWKASAHHLILLFSDGRSWSLRSSRNPRPETLLHATTAPSLRTHLLR